MNSPRESVDRMKDPSKTNELLSMLKHFLVLTQSTQLGFQPSKSPFKAPNIIFRLLLFFFTTQWAFISADLFPVCHLQSSTCGA
jgi:hypothetical protein